MAEENKHPPTTEEQAPPEMPGKAPEMEQAEIPDVGGAPAPSAKVIDLSAVRSAPEKDAPPDIPKEPEAPPVSVTEYSKQEWEKPMPEPEKPKPKRGRPAKAEKATPTEPGAKKEAQAEKEQTKLARKALEEFKASVIAAEEEDDKIARKMAKLQERKERKKQKQNAPASKQVFNRDVIEAGDNVRLKGQVSAGTVMEVQGKQAVVAFGMIKSTVKLEQLEKVSKGQIKKEIQKSTFVSVQTADDMHEKKLNFKQEIDVRGMRGDEALQAVTYFVDDAIQVGAARIRILHGTGTGILRQLIRDYLHTVPGVRQYHDEHVQFGGAGITVVELE